MAPSLPTPVRVAAGLVGSTLDRLRNLPQELPAIGVELAGQAFRIGLRVRQEVAALAVRGDDLLGRFGRPSSDQPSWATFDEDTPPTPPAAHAAPTPPAPRRGPAVPGHPDHSAATRPSAPRPAGPPRRPARSPQVDPESSPAAAAAAAARGTATAKSRVRKAPRDEGAPAAPITIPAPVPRAPEVSSPANQPFIGAERSGGDPLEKSTVDLRDVLAGLDEAAVSALLQREESGQARAAYLTLLGNRLTTLRAGAGS